MNIVEKYKANRIKYLDAVDVIMEIPMSESVKNEIRRAMCLVIELANAPEKIMPTKRVQRMTYRDLSI